MTAIDSARHYAHGMYKSVAEYFVPVASESNFTEKGTLTPEEFLSAGNQLVHSCPTWQWKPSLPEKKWEFLPPHQQYLETQGVPCLRRVADVQSDAVEETIEGGEWISAQTNDALNQTTQAIGDLTLGDDDIPDMEYVEDDETPTRTASTVQGGDDAVVLNAPLGIQIVEHEALNKETIVSQIDSDDDFEHIPDIETFDDEDNLAEPPRPTKPVEDEKARDSEEGNLLFRRTEADDTTIRTRTYDISITYDKYYRVPRVWLRGYDEHQNPLTSTQVFEDISSEHANKTVTIETHPHLDVVCASIHPCRHGDVMKIFIDRMELADKHMTVDQYMFLFLKFMSAVIPTMEFDYTKAFG